MIKKSTIAIWLIAALPVTTVAAGKSASASMQVSFTIVESCIVQTSTNQAQVTCQFDSPYSLQVEAAPVKVATDAGKGGEPMTIVYF